MNRPIIRSHPVMAGVAIALALTCSSGWANPVAKAAPAYGLSPEQLEARATDLCPIERIDVAARAGVPFCIIHGDDDKVVPLEPNSAELKKRYEAAGQGDLVTLIVAPGQGHSFWEGFFRCQELVDFAIARAKAGAAEETQPK